MIIELAHEKPVNLNELEAEILAAVPSATGIKVRREPQTRTVEGKVEYFGYEIEIQGAISESDQVAIEQAAIAHTPQKTTQEEKADAIRAARLAEFADIIEEAVKQATAAIK